MSTKSLRQVAARFPRSLSVTEHGTVTDRGLAGVGLGAGDFQRLIGSMCFNVPKTMVIIIMVIIGD
jgi:hypothetical protein